MGSGLCRLFLVIIAGLFAFCYSPCLVNLGAQTTADHSNPCGKPETRRIAEALNICSQVEQVEGAQFAVSPQRPSDSNQPLVSPQVLDNTATPASSQALQGSAKPLVPPQILPHKSQFAESTQASGGFGESREGVAASRINVAALRASLDINRVLLQVERERNDEEAAQRAAEKKAYRTTKLLNAVMGTSIGIVGSGMQISRSLTVQHAGDAVSVAGGAVTVFFALCTAELPATSQGKELRSADFPSTVRLYLRSDPTVSFDAETKATARKSPKRSFCHYNGDSDPASAERMQSSGLLSDELGQMNSDLSLLLKEVE